MTESPFEYHIDDVEYLRLIGSKPEAEPLRNPSFLFPKKMNKFRSLSDFTAHLELKK